MQQNEGRLMKRREDNSKGKDEKKGLGRQKESGNGGTQMYKHIAIIPTGRSPRPTVALPSLRQRNQLQRHTHVH